MCASGSSVKTGDLFFFDALRARARKAAVSYYWGVCEAESLGSGKEKNKKGRKACSF